MKSSIEDVIAEVEQANTINFIGNLKKLKGYKEYYRIRVGNYRIGLQIQNDVVTFAAFLHRKDIYKKFP
ncbi:MAG: type II toxin-antitoxin system RelE family toxin [Chitinophagaceae bacterium]